MNTKINRFITEGWGDRFKKDYRLSGADLILVNNELESLGRDWDTIDIYQVLEKLGIEGVKSGLLKSALGKADLYRLDNDDARKRAGEGCEELQF